MNRAIYSSTFMKNYENKENSSSKNELRTYLASQKGHNFCGSKQGKNGNKAVEVFRNRTLNS